MTYQEIAGRYGVPVTHKLNRLADLLVWYNADGTVYISLWDGVEYTPRRLRRGRKAKDGGRYTVVHPLIKGPCIWAKLYW